ncbi:hypothetical protein [Methylosinus sp. Ce-a6]|uniref:hypothetical protein n=1 Tax=Methylosinus sp. Ce-a6 TaxID=2172005 RepID=UPI001358324A|nr:hypothetical protein [Methylosinus sp. Ce-a6]
MDHGKSLTNSISSAESHPSANKKTVWSCVISGASIAWAGFAGPAAACSDLPNICEQQQQVHNWNMERAREAAQDYYEQQEEERQRRRDLAAEAAQLPDKTQRLLDSTLAMANIAKNTIEDSARMTKDPRYSWVRNGKWEFFQDTHTKKPGEFCAAMFINAHGAVRVSGPGDDYRGALLTFWGPNIPKPAAVRTIQVSLMQSDDGQTQTVNAFNYTDRSYKYEYGVIALAVPTADALLSNMQDKLGFRLDVSGETVLDIGWHSGFMARDKLSRCIGKRG